MSLRKRTRRFASIGRGTGSGASFLLGSELDGLAFAASDDSMVIRDTATPANNFVGAPGAKLAVLSADNRRYFNSSGLLVAAGATELRRDFDPRLLGVCGYLREGAKTNVVLWNRDLTNVAWTKSNATAVKDQTGIDGVANSASSLEATAGNGTALQAITLASSARFQSVYAKRLTGTGTIEMTMDNGSTWTAIILTAAWTKLSIPTQTLANPTVGFRIVTSGDKIAIDFVQNENGVFGTSPILTTTAAVARGSDNITLAASLFNATFPWSMYVRYAVLNTVAAHGVASLGDGTGTQRAEIRHQAGGAYGAIVTATGGTLYNDNAQGSLAALAIGKIAVRYSINSCRLAILGGSLGVHDTTCAAMPTTPTVLQLGAIDGGGSALDGWLIDFIGATTAWNDAALQARAA